MPRLLSFAKERTLTKTLIGAAVPCGVLFW